MNEYDLENIFTYHKPETIHIEKYQSIREYGKMFAQEILQNCPAGREKSLALTKIEEAVMWANASVARN